MKSFSSVLSIILTALLIISPVAAQPLAADAPLSDNPVLQLQLIDQGPGALSINSRVPRFLVVQVTDAAGMPVADAAVAFRLPDTGVTGSFPDGSHSFVRYTDANGKAETPEIQWNETAGPISIRITAAKGAAHAGLLVDETLGQPATAAAMGVASAPSSNEAPVNSNSTAAESEMGAQQVTRSGAASADSPIAQSDDPPSVSITSASPAGRSHSRTKWVILAGVVAAAGVGAMLALRGSSSGTSGASAASGISIGSPSISIGHP